MKRFLGAIALACVLSVSALAGELPTGGVPSPQPGELPTSGAPAPQPGELPTGGIASSGEDNQTSVAVILTILSFLSF